MLSSEDIIRIGAERLDVGICVPFELHKRHLGKYTQKAWCARRDLYEVAQNSVDRIRICH